MRYRIGGKVDKIYVLSRLLKNHRLHVLKIRIFINRKIL